MNLIQRYFLYKKITNLGPAASKKNEQVSVPHFTRIDWTCKSDKDTYQIRSYKSDVNKNTNRDYDFYWSDVYKNGTAMTTIIGGRMARKLYDMAAAAMQEKSR